MVEPSSPILSPASPTNSTTSSSSSQSQSSNASSSSAVSVASASSRGSRGSEVAPVVTPKVEEVNNGVRDNNDDDIIELSSDSEAEQGSGSLSPVSCSSSEPPEDDLEMIEEMRQMQRQLQLKLDILEKRVNKRRRLKQERMASQPEPTSVPVPAQNAEPLPSTSRQGTVETKQGLKRKLEIVTEELSRSRMDHAKKLRKNAPKEQMVIDIPDFPMEYYDISANYALYYEGSSTWFEHFNRNPEVIKYGNYYNWITERTNNLLPEVLKIMQNTQKRNVPVSDQLQNADLLACRPVCKSWKQCLDKYLQGQVSHQKNLDCWNVGGATSVATKISNRTLHKFNQLLSSISRTSGESQSARQHPFPSRQLRIEIHPVYSVESSHFFETGMTSFLETFGHEVSYLSFISYQDTSWFFMMIHALGLNWFTVRNWLLKMPNLRGVNFQFSPTTECTSDDREMHESVILASKPFPPLPKLEFVECHFIPSVLVDCMLSNNPQIKQLANFESYNTNVLPWPWADYQLNVLENLSHLSVNILKMTQVHTLQTVHLPLRNLHLSSIGPGTWNLGEVFRALRNFGNTLKQLRLKLRIDVPDNDIKLALPKLEELELCFQQNSADQISYDFILPLNSLKCLKVNFNWEIEANGNINGNGVAHDSGIIDVDEIEDKVEVIELKGYQNRLYFSNIWNLFPCLKRVIIEDREREESSVRTYKYTRDRLPKL